jgi:hypothetical protein
MRIVRWLSESLFLFVLILLAVAPAVALAAAAEPTNPSIEQLLTELLGSVETWKASGWLAGMVAVVNLLVNALKFKPLADWLEKLKIGWWLRPVISVVLGILAGVFSNLVGGASVGTALMIALLAGISSTGFHELMTALFNNRVQAERAAGAKILDLVKNADGAGAAAVASMQKDLAEISAIANQSARVAALAEWAKANPPKPNGVNPATPTTPAPTT